MLNRLVGENTYDTLRVTRRVFSNKFYYLRQHMLYRCFIESPDVACMLGIYPKTDNSHGYGSTGKSMSTQSGTKCTEISRKTPLTVTVPSECGS